MMPSRDHFLREPIGTAKLRRLDPWPTDEEQIINTGFVAADVYADTALALYRRVERVKEH